MSGDVQKIPLVIGLTRFAEDKIDDGIQLTGRSIPAKVVSIDATRSIVTVKFDMESDFFTLPQVECALATDRYALAPIKKDDPGYVVPADYYMGGVTGLGGGTANFEKPPNLSALVFHPTGNTNFSAIDDDFEEQYVITAPQGVVLKTDEGDTSFNLKEDGGVMIDAPIGHNCLGANLTEANDDADARGKGIPTFGFYYTPDGVVHMVRP